MTALTTQEREIRKQLEDAMSTPEHALVVTSPISTDAALNGHAQVNGTKAKLNGTSGKKGKQKKERVVV